MGVVSVVVDDEDGGPGFLSDPAVTPIRMRPVDQAAGRGSALLQVGPIFFAAAVIGLGIRSALTATFIPAWQPVPSDFPYRAVLAVADGLLLAALAAMTLFSSRRRVASAALATLLAAWILILQSPLIVAAPSSMVLWLGAGEVGALCAAAAAISSAASGSGGRSAKRSAVAARVCFGFCAVIFGLSHYAYADFTASMIPAWIPGHLFLAYATGTAHIFAGLAFISTVMLRAAAALLTLMMASFVVLIHVPAVVASKGSLVEITFLLNACALCGSAWTFAALGAPRFLPLKA